MTFTVIHIVFSFALGFLFGVLFGIGVYKMRNPYQSLPRSNVEPSVTKESPKQKKKVETLDIPRIKDSNENNNQDSINILSPALIQSSIEDSPDTLEEDQPSYSQPDDATVLMHRPPPK
jgi:hypothetical protein